MRILYLDESGIGKIDADPYLVVAGVLVHVDRQYMPLRDALSSILISSTPLGATVPANLHAKDIFNGSREFDRKAWDFSSRLSILDKIGEIPAKFRIPVVYGVVDRREHARLYPDDDARKHLVDCYSIATMQCLMKIEWYMRHIVGKKELSSVVMEINSDLQKRVKEIYRYAKSGNVLSEVVNRDQAKRLLPLTRIIDEPSFQEKAASSMLQLADYCAFSFKRSVELKEHHERLSKPLAPAVIQGADKPGDAVKVPVWDFSLRASLIRNQGPPDFRQPQPA